MGVADMVTSVTSFSRTGLSDWLIQRVTSLVLLAYFIVIAYQLVGSVDYTSWRLLFDQTWMKVFTLMAALSLVAHSWIGLWSVFTDYLTERMLGPKGNIIRLLSQLGASLALLGYVIWVVVIIWS
ncbi:MAG: succinate dehydrogenase, hydrophobic membrane anchor protein [Luminiphilus sp.]|jgi:succinate dehydrogenase / fumarate reductase membrane anchor subunit